MANGIELTDAEKLARDHFMMIHLKATKLLCEDDEPSSFTTLPNWYNEDLYKRGQKYFKKNRTGILYSNYLSLIAFLAEPRGIGILKFTGRSETPQAAKQRYIAILLYVLSWYSNNLTEDSKSFKSLSRLKRVHYLASKALHSRGIPGITHADMANTAFGFMGFVLTRPHLLPINHPTKEEKEAFVHFWAVICYMVGVKDEYNICLLPLDAIVVYCQMIIRYSLLPLIQIKTVEFDKMVKAVTVGMKRYLIEVDFHVDLFATKRILLVPGYQLHVNSEREVHCRSILSQDDVDMLNEKIRSGLGSNEGIYYTVDIPIIEVTKTRGYTLLENEYYNQMPIIKRMILQPDEKVIVKMINYERDWQSCLNDSKFNELSMMNKLKMLKRDFYYYLCDSSVGRFLSEKVLSLAILTMKRFNKRSKIPITNNNKWIKDA